VKSSCISNPMVPLWKIYEAGLNWSNHWKNKRVKQKLEVVVVVVVVAAAAVVVEAATAEHTRERLQSTATTVNQLMLKTKDVHNRKDVVLLAQIRSEHCDLFQAYQHQIDSTTDPTCQVCVEAPHTMEHWLLDCPALSLTRIKIFGRHISTWTSLIHLRSRSSCWQCVRSFTECALACVPASTTTSSMEVPGVRTFHLNHVVILQLLFTGGTISK